MLSVYIPEQDASLDALELVEHLPYLKFHHQTLQLYGALCAQGNYKVAHELCKHVNEEQLIFAIQNQCKF